MRAIKRKCRQATLGMFAGVMAMQFGGCNIDLGNIELATAATVDLRDVLVGLIREAIITPIDLYITDGINGAFDVIEGADDN